MISLLHHQQLKVLPRFLLAGLLVVQVQVVGLVAMLTSKEKELEVVIPAGLRYLEQLTLQTVAICVLITTLVRYLERL